MFEHEDAVRDADSQRTAGHALADDDGHDRNPQPRHLPQVERDGLADTALLGADAGIRTDGVDESDDGTAEFFRLPHKPEGLAVTLRVSHPEVALEVLLHVAALLMAHDHDRPASQPCPAPDHCPVVAERAVAVEFDPLGEHPLDVVEGVRALWVPSDLNLLDRAQVVVGLLLQLLEPGPEDLDLFRDVYATAIREIQELVDLRLDLDDVPLEI